MTFLHFVNCAALTYAPIYITYKSSLIKEYGSLSIVLWAMLGYFMTQGLKMVLLATLLPGSDIDDNTFSLMSELMKTIINVVDVIGIGYVMDRQRFSGIAKIWGVGLGWAAAEALGRRLATLYVEAWQGEFTWTPIIESLDSNTRIIAQIAFACTVFCLRRKHVRSSIVPTLVGGIALYSAWPSIVAYCTEAYALDALSVLIMNAAFAVVFGIYARAMYSS